MGEIERDGDSLSPRLGAYRRRIKDAGVGCSFTTDTPPTEALRRSIVCSLWRPSLTERGLATVSDPRRRSDANGPKFLRIVLSSNLTEICVASHECGERRSVSKG